MFEGRYKIEDYQKILEIQLFGLLRKRRIQDQKARHIDEEQYVETGKQFFYFQVY
jgi:hypothetical protein